VEVYIYIEFIKRVCLWKQLKCGVLCAHTQRRVSFLILLIILIMISSLSGGTISGEVIEYESGKPIPGANVLIDGSNLGASTDISGKFILENIPVGEHALRIYQMGYCLQTDIIHISRERDLLSRQYRLKYPLIHITESQESKDYHDRISHLKESISIEIENIEIKNDQVILEISIMNRRDFDIFIPKNLPCFKVWDIIIHDEDGNRAEPMLIGSNCDVQPSPLPQAGDVFIIKAHSKVTYPDKIYSSRFLNTFEKGRYAVRLDYRYTLRRSLGGAHIGCGDKLEDFVTEIDIMKKFIRGYFVSSNIKYFTMN